MHKEELKIERKKNILGARGVDMYCTGMERYLRVVVGRLMVLRVSTSHQTRPPTNDNNNDDEFVQTNKKKSAARWWLTSSHQVIRIRRSLADVGGPAMDWERSCTPSDKQGSCFDKSFAPTWPGPSVP